ncbi:MAG: hypothetical protein RLZZ387_1159 [Chloroflexota bacterium]|jgi:glycosyltransferase involved in cell wall biosynthesis
MPANARPLLLYVTDSEGMGGAESYLLTLLRHVDTARFRLGLVLPPREATQPLVDAVLARGGVAAELEGVHHEGLDPLRIARAAALFRRLRPAIVHFVLPSPRRCAEGVIGAFLSAVPLRLATFQLVTPTPVFTGPMGVIRGVNRTLQARTLTRGIAVSAGNRRLLVEQYGVHADRLNLIPNGVDTERFQPRPPDPASRAAWDIPADAPLVGVFGRLSRQKGHRVLFEAMPRVWEAHPRAHLVVGGQGELEQELRALAAQAGGAGRVHFAGQIEDVPATLAAVDLVVLPSLYEGLPFAALEGMAMERAVVATAVDGTAEVIEHGHSGLLVPPGDPEALAAGLITALGDTALRAQLGRAGRERILARFDQHQMLERTFALYDGGRR